MHFIKYPRILQTLFFLLRYSREDICVKGTAMVDFKKVKSLIDDKLFAAMGSYNPYGPQPEEFKQYQKLSWLKANIS